MIEKLNWLKENAKIFLDQNIKHTREHNQDSELRKRGFQRVTGVYQMGWIGATDGKLLRLIKENRMILVTYDKKFSKMAKKYNGNMQILIDGSKKWGNRRIALEVERDLLKRFDEVKKFYEIEESQKYP